MKNTLIENERYDNVVLSDAVQTLRSGGIVLFPTDASWCLGCDSQNEQSVTKLLALHRELPVFTALVDMVSKIQNYVEEFPDIAWDLLDVAEKPLSLRLQGVKNMSKSLNGKEKYLFFRETKELFSKDLCRRMKNPILCVEIQMASLPIYGFEDIPTAFKEGADYVVNYKQSNRSFKGITQKIALRKGGLVEILK